MLSVEIILFDQFVTDFLDKWDSQKRVQLLVTIESAKGVIKLSEITEFGSQNRVTALVVPLSLSPLAYM